MNRFAKVAVLTAVLVSLALVANAASSVTPDAVRKIFDANVTIAMFVWGIIQTRVPALKALANNAVGWVNVLAYIAVSLFAPPAHAGILGVVPDAVGTLIGGAFGNASAAFMLYEVLGRSVLDRFFNKYDNKHPGGVKAPA